MPEFNAGEVKASLTADTQGMHAGVERSKKDFRDLAQAIADAMRIVKKEENEATKAERERQKAARDAANAEKQAAQEKKQAYQDLGLAAGVSFTALAAAIWKSTQANNELKASMAGLDSVATGNIGSYDKIKKELQQIQENGLIPLVNATQAYKNLISRYKDEDVAIQMFHKIADAAAFGRQAHLSLGEAIQGTSEGLKNEMSNLTDNGGITKNLSVMWKEYAAQIGKTVGQLTEAEKRQAEVNGFMEEGRFQTGDLAKLQQQLAGQMAKATAETNLAAAAYGDALEPALGVAANMYSELMKGVRDFIQSSPGIVSGATAGAAAMTGLVAVTSAWIALDMGNKLKKGFDVLTGNPVGIALIAISALTSAIVGISTAAAKAREENIKLADKYRDETVEVKSLIAEYKDLQKIVKPTADQKQRMLDLSNQIAKILPGAITGWDNEHNAIVDVNGALREMILLKGQELRLRLSELDNQDRSAENRKKSYQRQLNEANDYLKQIDEIKKKVAQNPKSLLPQERILLHDEPQYQQKALGLETIIKGIENDKQTIIKERDAINNLLSKGITPEDITSPTKPEKTPGPGDDQSAETKKRTQEQADLAAQLYTERLERLKQFQDAEITEENKRYQSEVDLAKGNKNLLEAVEQGHKDRLKAIDDKYTQQKLDADRARTIQELQLQADLKEAQGQNLQAALDRDRAQEMQELADTELTEQQKDQIKRIHEQNRQNIEKQFSDQEKSKEDQKMQYLYDNHRINTEQYRDYLTQRLADYEQYSDEWIRITNQIEALNHQLNVELTGVDWVQLGDDMKSALHDGLVSGLTDAIMQGKQLGEVFNQLARQILQLLAQRAIVEPLVNGIMSGLGWGSYHDGGEVQPIPKAHSGMFISDTIIRAHNGLNLAPDEVPIIAQTGERVLSRQQNKDYEAMMSSQAKMDVQVNVINQTGQPVAAQQQSAGFDGQLQRYVVNVILDNVARNGELRPLFKK